MEEGKRARRLAEAEVRGYEESLVRGEKSAATVEKYGRDIRAFQRWLGGEAVTKERVMAYKAELWGRGQAARSVNSNLAAINGLLGYLGWTECRVKALKVQREAYCPQGKEMTRGEYERLVRAAKGQGKERLSLILQTLCGTGMRVSELRFVTVEAARQGEAVVTLKGKTRRVFLVEKLRRLLLSYARERGIRSGPLFVTRTGKPVSRMNIWRDMKGLCEAAGVSPGKVYPHNLRHLFARIYYGMKADLAKLADILGHASVDTTRIYIISTGEEHRRGMERLGLILGP